MKKNQEQIVVSDRERSVVGIVRHLDDTELFGVECFLAGLKAKAMRNSSETNSNENVLQKNKGKR